MKTIRTTLYCLLLIIITSCHDDNQIEEPSSNYAITFAAKSKDAFSRGTPIGSSNQMDNMVVYGYYTGQDGDNWASKGSTAGPNLPENLVVNNLGKGTGTDNWDYNPPIFWPFFENANLSFFAYAPVASATNGISVNSTTGGLFLDYELPSDCANHTDLLFAVPQLDLNRTLASEVKFDFKHALTCLEFSAIGKGQTIKSIELKNFIAKGSVSYDFNNDSLKWVLGSVSSAVYTPVMKDVVLNPDGYQPIISTNGYMMMIPQILGPNAELIMTLSTGETTTYPLAGQQWRPGQQINYMIDLTGDPVVIKNEVMQNSYIGAFWKHNETQERIIRMPNTGKWEVHTLCVDNQWNIGDVMLDTLPPNYSKTWTDPIPGPPVSFLNTYRSISGTGDIAFRIGIQPGAVLPSASSKPRYAILVLTYDNLQKQQSIYLRQGEAPDVVNGTAKFSPYNLSSKILSGTPPKDAKYDFVKYPTYAGGYKQWNDSARMYQGVNYPPAENWDTLFIGKTIANVCPDGYAIPSKEDLLGLVNGTMNVFTDKAISGFYADGSFDRQNVHSFTVGAAPPDSTFYYTGYDETYAFGGVLFFNETTYASVFLPYGGKRTTRDWVARQAFRGSYWANETIITTHEGKEVSYPYGLEMFATTTAPWNKYIVKPESSYIFGSSIRPVLK